MTLDWFTQYWDKEASERQRLRDLGQSVPEDVTFEGPETPVDESERQTLFPNGLPSTEHQGGLAQLAAIGQTPETQQQQQEAGANKAPMVGPVAGKANTTQYLTNAPDAMARADREQRKGRAYGDIGWSVGTIARMAAGAYAGGGGGGGGGGAGFSMDVPGGATGVADAGVSGTSMQAPASGGGGGLMGAYDKYQGGDYMGAAKDAYGAAQDSGALGSGDTSSLKPGEAPHGQNGAGGDPLSSWMGEASFLWGSAGKRRSALARLGQLPGFESEMQTGPFFN